jgi:hypothetical protein
MTIGKNRSTAKGRELWDAVDAAAAEVRTWPAWKRGISEERPKQKSQAEAEPAAVSKGDK